jgi:hypothetical protein
MMTVRSAAKVPDEERRHLLYAGDVLTMPYDPALGAMVELADEMLRNAFAPHDPRSIHQIITAEQCATILKDLKPAFIHHPKCKYYIQKYLQNVGCDPEKTYFDVPRMRSAYPSNFLTSGIAYAFHPHRDTWYSAPPCQLNWWLPIYPLHRENCMAFHPNYFNRPVRNNSEDYNYYEWNRMNRTTAAQHVKTDTRVQPKPQEVIDRASETRILPDVGCPIIFSGAQLHETVENKAGIGRYSIDFRTVHLDDVLAHRGASNVDSRCTGTTMRDYLRVSDLSHLPDEAIALYDDGTEVQSGVLYFGDRLLREGR